MEITQRIYSGARAQEVLDNPAFSEAFDDIEKELLEKWKSSPARDEQGREKLYLMTFLLSKLKMNLEASIFNGKQAQLDLQHQRSIAERVKDAKSAFWE